MKNNIRLYSSIVFYFNERDDFLLRQPNQKKEVI
jgi:hypothetical protein